MNVEPSDVVPASILKIGAGLVVGVVLVFAIIYFGLRAHRRTITSAPPTAKLEVPAPRLQARPAVDMAALRTENAAALESYGWVDRKSGIVRVPIDRAMELTLQKGLPAR